MYQNSFERENIYMKYSLLIYLSLIVGYPASSTNRISGIQHKPDIRYPALDNYRISGKITIRRIPSPYASISPQQIDVVPTRPEV